MLILYIILPIIVYVLIYFIFRDKDKTFKQNLLIGHITLYLCIITFFREIPEYIRQINIFPPLIQLYIYLSRNLCLWYYSLKLYIWEKPINCFTQIMSKYGFIEDDKPDFFKIKKYFSKVFSSQIKSLKEYYND